MAKARRKILFSKANWIWSEESIEASPKGSEIASFQVSNFRCNFELASVLKSVTLHCCADSKYHLWVNGNYVGFGPARGHRDHPYYDTHEIAKYLRAGKNVVAFRVQHYSGGANIFAAVQGGLICEVSAPELGVLAATDASWRALASKAYRAIQGVIFAESFDAREEPEGWQNPGFNDARWPRARVLTNSKLAPRENILPRPIPPLTQTLFLPETVLDVASCGGYKNEESIDKNDPARPVVSISKYKLDPVPDGMIAPEIKPQTPWPRKSVTIRSAKKSGGIYFALDFGQTILANLELTLKGPAGAVVELGYCEVLLNNLADSTPFDWLAFCDRIITRKGTTVHRVTQPRAFRYLMLRVSNVRADVVIENLSAFECIYPTKTVGEFHSSDKALDKIFDLSARTVNLCMEDAYTDCPTRERSQWLGDFQPEGLFSYYAFGEYDLARKAIWEYGHGNTEEGWIPGVFPITKPFNLPTWGMRFPVIVWEYFLHTGDRETLNLIYDGVTKQMDWFANFENKEGLLENLTGWSFLDWTKLDWNFNDGAVQGWYLEALEHCVHIAREFGDAKSSRKYRAKAERLRKTLAEAYWSKKRGAFMKYTPLLDKRPSNARHDLLGQHENFLFSLLKVGSPAMRKQAIASMKGAAGKYLPNIGGYQSYYSKMDQYGSYSSEETIFINTPFWSYYALLALMEVGEDEAAIEYIRICWGLMLDHGATTCWEMWDRNTSHCHGWSAAPAMILPAYILGVKPLKPGFAEFEIAPRLGGLEWAKGTVPTVKGLVRVAWKLDKAGGDLTCTINVPQRRAGEFGCSERL